MKALWNDLSHCNQAGSLNTTWIGVWTFLCASLTMTLYLSIVCNLNFFILFEVQTVFPIRAYFWVLTSTVIALLATIFVSGLVAARQLSSVDRSLRHALHSVREGELSTRLNLGEYEGCEGLEQAFNEAMEVIQHRIENR
jgi:HAMP domain-containing protein